MIAIEITNLDELVKEHRGPLSALLGKLVTDVEGELRGVGRSLLDHLRLRHPHGEEARRYNVLQNIAY
ncbi:MAG TPA: hypothetical protein VFM34_12430, partial [Moraxellaceae bacterium]|nr:hypothetical protein [Moraxellaceae bacterium]